MQTPDADGYVNITWPSKTIPHGGLFHTRIPDPNNCSTREFLKACPPPVLYLHPISLLDAACDPDLQPPAFHRITSQHLSSVQMLLDEAKLAAAQKQRSCWEHRLRQDDDEPARPPQPRRPPAVRPSTSRRRSLSTIRESGAYEHDGNNPLKRGEDREKLKERLQRLMERGDADDQRQTTPSPAPAQRGIQLPTTREKKQDLLTQIRERAEWLAEMEALGAGAPHRDVIQEQISERMRMLAALGGVTPCSSARSRASSCGPVASARSVCSSASNVSRKSLVSQVSKKPKPARSSQRAKGDENVAAYSELPKLQYSPRRRQ